MTDEERIAAADTRYRAAAHAMQSGVAMEMNYPERASATEPKHLRVGVNSAMVNDVALATLLIEKGIITKPEYHEAVASAMEDEARRYEASISQRVGGKVTLA